MLLTNEYYQNVNDYLHPNIHTLLAIVEMEILYVFQIITSVIIKIKTETEK